MMIDIKIMTNLVRKIAERFGRNRIVRRRITVAGKRASILVSPDAQLKYLKFGRSAFDEDLINLAIEHVNEKDTVWDIGSNVGVFAFAAALRSKSGTIVAVEPDTWLVGLLRKTSLFQDYADSDIRILPAAISDQNTVAELLIASRGRASNALTSAGGRSQMGGTREKQFVATLTLDRLLESFPRPNFVKIDIEGAELMALKSAEKLIKSIRPKFYIEVGENVASQVYEIFDAANYSALDPKTQLPIDRCVDNTLFIPN